MGLIAFLAGTLLLAAGCLPHVLRGEEPEAEGGGPGSRLSALLLLWFAVMVGANWLLAAVHVLSAPGLWAVSGLAAGTGLWLLRNRLKGPWAWRRPATDPVVAWSALLLLAGAYYMVLRGSTAFIAEFDAVSYHLPKAVEVLKSGTIPFINAGDYRLPYFPWNYELLVADTLILTGGDRHAYLVGLLATVAFCVNAVSVLRRAWPASAFRERLLAVVLLAATPVLLMHADAFKNDVIFCFFLLAFLDRFALWWIRGDRASFILAFLALGLAFGTKSSALFLGPLVLAGLVVHRRRFLPSALGGARGAALAAAGLLAACALTGCAWPFLNLAWCGRPLGDFAQVGGHPGFEAMAVPRYIGFQNLWRFPILVFTRPFSPNPEGVWVFWEQRYWFWPSYRSMYGHWGWLCSVLLLLVPLGLRAHRREGGEAARYRRILTGAGVAFAFLSMPQQYRIDGMFCGFPRYLLFVPVLVALWGLLPALAWLRERGRQALASVAAAGLCLYFAAQAIHYIVQDGTKPLDTVLQLLSRPGARVSGGVGRYVDRAAQPGHVVAFDSGFGGMVYPMYGRGFTRRVAYLKVAEGRTVEIGPEVDWVVTDRAWNVGWSRPGVTSAGDFWQPVRPNPSREDRVVFEQLSRDPEFALVYHDPSRNEAAFVRRKHLKQPPPS